jgi:hypothetical protein
VKGRPNGVAGHLLQLAGNDGREHPGDRGELNSI